MNDTDRNDSNDLDDLIRRFIHSRRVSVQVIRHLIVGASGVTINWLVFSALRHYTELSTLVCTLIVHAILLIYIFPLQKHFTFRQGTRATRQMIRFLINDVFYMTFDFLLALLFIDVIGLLPVVGKACGLAVLTPASFLSQRLWVFAADTDAPAVRPVGPTETVERSTLESPN